MNNFYNSEKKIEQIIDELKGICSQNGLSNQASEERIITTIFLYKFLNDKFMYNLNLFALKLKKDYKELLINKNDELNAFYDTFSGEVAFSREDTIEFLTTKLTSGNFYQELDLALDRISSNPRNDNFNLETADGTKKKLFEGISEVVESSSKNNFAKAIFATISQEKFDFKNIFGNNFDFYSRIFEHLIKDYNVASGTYAEYFTPQAVSKIIAKVLVGMSPASNSSEIYDPSAGSGSLVLHLSNELGREKGIAKSLVYTQDISNKSSRFLRINLLLNGMTDSLHNVIQGDTLLYPAHFIKEKNQSSGLRKFDYIVSNPPFKMDFSSTRDQIYNKWKETNHDGLNRFYAGVPEIPANKKERMSIYLLFIQHIIFSLKNNGKAAIVVPTGFLTAKSGIEFKIRKHLIENNLLKGVISMPSNIFANTGTNVSILFVEKNGNQKDALLLDVSSFGSKVKEGKNQRTVLSEVENEIIIKTFVERTEKENISTVVNYNKIIERNYSFSAGHYFEVSIKNQTISKEEFESKLNLFTESLEKNIEESKKIESKIISYLKEIKNDF